MTTTDRTTDLLTTKFKIHSAQHIDFCAYLLGLPEGAAWAFECFTTGERAALLERLEASKSPLLLKSEWIDARYAATKPQMSVSEQGAEWLR